MREILGIFGEQQHRFPECELSSRGVFGALQHRLWQFELSSREEEIVKILSVESYHLNVWMYFSACVFICVAVCVLTTVAMFL